MVGWPAICLLWRVLYISLSDVRVTGERAQVRGGEVAGRRGDEEDEGESGREEVEGGGGT